MFQKQKTKPAPEAAQDFDATTTKSLQRPDVSAALQAAERAAAAQREAQRKEKERKLWECCGCGC